MNARRAHIVANAVLFQLAWIVCVQGKSGWAIAMTALVMLFNWRVVVINRREWQLWLATLLVGFLVDSLLLVAGVLHVPDSAVVQPPWLACLWLLFASTLLHSTSFLLRNLPLAAGFGFVGGPLAYYAGAQFGAAGLGSVSFETLSPLYAKWIALAVLAVCWSLVTPLLVMFARHFAKEGRAPLVKGC